MQEKGLGAEGHRQRRERERAGPQGGGRGQCQLQQRPEQGAGQSAPSLGRPGGYEWCWGLSSEGL